MGHPRVLLGRGKALLQKARVVSSRTLHPFTPQKPLRLATRPRDSTRGAAFTLQSQLPSGLNCHSNTRGVYREPPAAKHLLPTLLNSLEATGIWACRPPRGVQIRNLLAGLASAGGGLCAHSRRPKTGACRRARSASASAQGFFWRWKREEGNGALVVVGMKISGRRSAGGPQGGPPG